MDGCVWIQTVLLALTFITLPKPSLQGPYEKALLEYLFVTNKYNILERPAANDSEPLEVQLKLTLQQIIDVDEKNQIISSNVWLDMSWNDYSLTWDPQRFGGIAKIRLPPKQVWRPDILMYNSADESFDGTYATNVVISHDGSVSYIPPGMFKSTCKIDITWFPFDDQRCDMKFGSWTYDGTKINLTLPSEKGDSSTFMENGEWDLIDVPAKLTVFKYECCPEPYIDITFTIHIRRRTLYYGFNLIIPCVLISSMALLTFVLPPDAGEKISLGVTILLSLTVFLLLVAETMPPTSDAVPLIGMYFACIMMMCSLSVVFTVLVLNYHHRSAETHEMPTWVKKGVCEWLAWGLRMRRPGKELSRKKLIQNAKLRELEMKERSSKSLLANVLDLDDDFRRDTSNGSFSVKIDDNFHVCTTRNELHSIIKELKFITNKMKKDEDDSEVSSDWKFAAMVIDRLCLVMFTSFTFISTFAILFSAPHILS
ncbi:neuronal acetylcholine receptor subunit alpha-7-like isoform X2 [Tubulanus polymorphus]|uniref:neuronal acetylcholine receptor subunit alpha-7-like isoform X2 n=1 Tax=Tubulanus polymorphus TaxID=672921 RepID=UPI003DA3E0D1